MERTMLDTLEQTPVQDNGKEKTKDQIELENALKMRKANMKKVGSTKKEIELADRQAEHALKVAEINSRMESGQITDEQGALEISQLPSPLEEKKKRTRKKKEVPEKKEDIVKSTESQLKTPSKKTYTKSGNRESFASALDQVETVPENEVQSVDLQEDGLEEKNDLDMLPHLSIDEDKEKQISNLSKKLGSIAKQEYELEKGGDQSEETRKKLEQLNLEHQEINAMLIELNKDRPVYVRKEVVDAPKQEKVKKIKEALPPKSKKEKVETSVNQPQPENVVSDFDSQIIQIRSEIKEYEETIKAIERGEKFAVPGAKVEDFHNKIVEAENRLREIENKNLEHIKQEESPIENSEVSSTLEVPGFPVFNEVNTGWVLNYTFGESVEQNTSKEKIEIIQDKIEKIKDFEELYAFLKTIPGIQGSTVFFDSNTLINLVKEVQDGLKGIRYITRSQGLRNKVWELLTKDNKVPGGEIPKQEAKSKENPKEEPTPTNPEKIEDIPSPDIKDPDNKNENSNESDFVDVEVVPELTPEEFLERQKRLEALYVSLENARETFIVEYHKYLKERRNSGAIAWIRARLGIAKQEDESQLPESLNEARELYDQSKIAYAQELRTQLHERGATTAEINVEVYDKIILDEYALRKRAEAELWTPKEKGVLRKSLDWYMKQNRFVRVGISSALLTGAIAATGGLGVVAGSAVFAGRYIRGVISVTTGQLAGVGFDKIFKDKTGEKLEEAIQGQRQEAQEIDQSVKDPLQQLHDMEKALEETYSKSEADKRKRLLAKSAVMLAATLGANAGLRQLEELYQPSQIPPPVTPRPEPGPEPIPPNPTPSPDLIPTGDEALDISSAEEIPPINPFEVSSTNITITPDANNLWSAIKVKLQAEGLLSQLETSGQQTHMVDQVYNVFEKMTPEQLKAIGIASGDVQRVMTGSTLDLSSVFGKPEVLQSMFGGSTELAQQAIANIEAQGRVISAFQAANPNVMLTPELIKQIVTRSGL